MEEAFKINQKSSKHRNDTAVQGTNDSSVLSKISTAQLGYFKDNFLQHFAAKLARRSPLVNRGYYIRAKLIDFVIRDFLNRLNDSKSKNQIINLGAGFDSTFFRLRDNNALNNTLFIEIDFPDVINRKVNLIKLNQNLYNLCPDLIKIKDINGNSIYHCTQSNYVLIGLDMRNTKLLEAILKTIPGFSDSDPTFLLSEVVLTYMAVNSCNGVIKWVSEMFQNCCLTVYEQINPFDTFGQVMCTHFKKLGSPLKCILKYPTETDQINRYKSEGFNDAFTVKASEFYRCNISNDEKKRIDNIELFDEYEPWHLKCSHYILLSATKGEFCTNLIQNLYASCKSKIDPINELSNSQFNLDILKLKPFPVKFGIRFGHSVCVIKSKLFVFGGFGELATDTLGKHLRLPFIEVLDLDNMHLKVLELESSPIGDRIFQSCKTFDDNSILITYGRSNPSKLFNSVVKLNYQENSNKSEEINEKEISFEIINPIVDDNINLSRYRHAVCRTFDSKLLVYGGKFFEENTSSNVILNDAYLLDKSNSLTKLNVDENVCKARHSHSLCQWKNFIIISGGLDSNENPLNDLILIDCITFEFKKIVLKKGYVLPRYSHTAHVIDDTLILIGGTNLEAMSPGVCFVDLNRLCAYEFNLPSETPDNNRLITTCHQTHILDKNNILLIGGGAVCFTFGTHLNKQPVVLDISECWSKIN